MGLDKSRRSLLKAIGAGTTACLAGCSGDGNTDNSINSNNSSGEGGNKPFDGVTIEWWDWLSLQSRQLKQGLIQTAKEFERDTGATVKISFAPGWGSIGSKWPSTIESGNVPHIFNQPPQYGNSTPREYWYVHDNLVKDFSNLYDDVDLNAFSDRLELDRYMARGWPEIDVVSPMQLQLPRTVMVWRTDYWEEAGIIDDFPPKSMEELLEAAATIEQETDADAGFAPPGKEANYWFNERSAQNGPRSESSVFNEDFTGMNVTNEAWTQPFQDAETFSNSNATPENTVSLADEKTFALTALGQYGGTVPDPMGHSLLLQQFPDVIDAGNIEWTPFNGWESSTGSPTKIWGAGNTILKDPRDRSAKRKRREKAAVHFLTQYWMSENFQSNIPNRFEAFFPTRTDVFEETKKNVNKEQKHHYAETMATSIKNSDAPVTSWGTKEIQWSSANDPASPNWQQVYQGQMTPKEAVSVWEETTSDQNNLN